MPSLQMRGGATKRRFKPYKTDEGSRLDVWNGKKIRTPGGLRKEDLMKNKWGKIVSKKKSVKMSNPKNNILFQKGFKAQKGSFGPNVVK
jgi:hypothetical protein